MSHLEDFAAALSGFSGLSPMMMVNRSGTCATTRLLQCTQVGVYELDVSSKFGQSPDYVGDLDKDDFIARKRIVDEVAAWVNANSKGSRMPFNSDEWVPILYQYEIVKGSAKRNRDRGHLVFTDLTVSRFLLVMCFGDTACDCGSPFHHDYSTIVKYHANRFMSLLRYIHHDQSSPQPKWVRATYTTSNNRSLDPELITSRQGPKEGTDSSPPIFHVTPDNFVPSLLPSDLEKMDNIMAQGSKKPPPATVKAAVLGKKDDRPQMTAYIAADEKNPRLCAYCEKIGKYDMPMCGRCKLVRYCSPECQNKAWPNHKIFCKKAALIGKV